MMKALTFDPESDQFELSTLPVPEIGDADALVKVEACGLNPVDAKIRHWKSFASGMDNTWVPGLDVSGRILKRGSKVDSWKIGDRVLCHGNMFRPHGGFAEFSVQDAETLIPHPDLSAEAAASTPCAGWTAWRSLVDKLRINEQPRSILITGGSGGVGSFALQIASHFKVETIITTCSSANHQYVTELGATHAIDYRNEDVVSRALEITNQQGVSIGLDTIGEDNDILVANSLRFEGQMVTIATTTRPLEYQDAFGKGLSFHQLSLGAGHRYGASTKADLTKAGRSLSALIEQGKITLPTLKTVSLEETGEALNNILKQRTVGKVVLKFADA